MVKRMGFVYLSVSLLSALFATAVARAGVPEVPSALRVKVAATGEVSVIASLNLPGPGFKAEGHLPAAAVAEQRRSIAATRKSLLDSLRGLNAREYRSWESVPSVALKVDGPALEFLARHPLVAAIQEDALSPPLLASTTHFIGADVTFGAGFGGLGQTVVILDTGIDADHPFYGGRVVWEACFSNGGGGGVDLCTNGASGGDSADVTVGTMADNAHCDTTAANLCAHGSHVAGIAAGRDPGGAGATGFNGIAPEASIIAIQIFTRFNADADCGGPGTAPCVLTYDSDQISALNYVNTTLHPNWSISSINMSLGGGGPFSTACDGDARKAPIDNLVSDNIATVIAAGNNGFTDGVSKPGCISTAVTIGAVWDGTCSGVAADTVTFNMGSLVDLMAVGKCVDSSIPDDNYANFSGTSMATPEVTGAFAMLRAIAPGMSVADILSLLQTTGVLVTDMRDPNPAGAATGHVKPRIALAAAAAQLLTADLSVTKLCKPDGPIAAGQTATCTILVQNLGPDPALNVTIVDQLVSSGTFTIGTVTINGGGSCTTTPNPQNGSGTVTCTVPSILPNASVTIAVPVSATTAEDINDVVTVSSETPDPNLGNNTATGRVSFVAASDLALQKSASPDPVTAGQNLTYSIQVTNLGPSSAPNVVVKDALPALVSFVSSAPSQGTCQAGVVPGDPTKPLTCNLGTLANGAAATITVIVKVNSDVPAGTILVNNADVSSDNPDPNNGNNLATAAVTVQATADLAITKTSDADTYKPSTQVTYQITVSNNGPSKALNAVVTDNLPDIKQAIYQSDTGGCVKSTPTTLVCNMGDLALGQTRTFFVYVLIKGSQGNVSNTASVTSSTPDPNLANNSSTRVVLVGKK